MEHGDVARGEGGNPKTSCTSPKRTKKKEFRDSAFSLYCSCGAETNKIKTTATTDNGTSKPQSTKQNNQERENQSHQRRGKQNTRNNPSPTAP